MLFNDKRLIGNLKNLIICYCNFFSHFLKEVVMFDSITLFDKTHPKSHKIVVNGILRIYKCNNYTDIRFSTKPCYVIYSVCRNTLRGRTYWYQLTSYYNDSIFLHMRTNYCVLWIKIFLHKELVFLRVDKLSWVLSYPDNATAHKRNSAQIFSARPTSPTIAAPSIHGRSELLCPPTSGLRPRDFCLFPVLKKDTCCATLQLRKRSWQCCPSVDHGQTTPLLLGHGDLW